MDAYPGHVSVIRDHYAEAVPQMIAAAVQLQKLGEVFFIDCASRFDPYSSGKAAGRRGRERLQRILVSQPITANQLKELVLEKLEGAITARGCRVLLVNCINHFDRDGAGSAEAAAIRLLVQKKLSELTRRYRLTTIVSESWR